MSKVFNHINNGNHVAIETKVCSLLQLNYATDSADKVRQESRQISYFQNFFL
jgi:hypothetical protein